ncbi:MAG: cysteine desulfurase family protein [Flavobacteriales bacterium]
MKGIYFDNAATTPMDNEVVEAMLPYMKEYFGNPSSTHAFGRKVKSAVESSRMEIAKHLNCDAQEVYFTSGGTEADNIAIKCSVRDLGIKHIISSPIEHHAVLHTVQELEEKENVKLSMVDIKPNGHVDMDHLKTLLEESDERCLVSLMHGNNEIGNLLPLKRVGDLCKKYDAIFHSDTVQTMAHYKINLEDIHVHFITGSAHKFHGPKGAGFLYKNKDISLEALIHGGSQERNLRAGTENIYGIVGLAKAMEIAHRDMEEHQKHVQGLKDLMIKELEEKVPGVEFVGDAKGSSLYTVLNVQFPESENGDMILFNLDLQGIAISGGSACSSGSTSRSHVQETLNTAPEKPTIRFSFSRFNTEEEVRECAKKVSSLFETENA